MGVYDRRARLRAFAGFIFAAFLVSTGPALAGKAPVYSADGDVAVKGADVVAYFTQKRSVIGKAQFSHRWKGRVWRFSSAAHLAAFKANPEKYAPQFGGYCAYAVSRGYTAKSSPRPGRSLMANSISITTWAFVHYGRCRNVATLLAAKPTGRVFWRAELGRLRPRLGDNECAGSSQVALAQVAVW